MSLPLMAEGVPAYYSAEACSPQPIQTSTTGWARSLGLGVVALALFLGLASLDYSGKATNALSPPAFLATRPLNIAQTNAGTRPNQRSPFLGLRNPGHGNVPSVGYGKAQTLIPKSIPKSVPKSALQAGTSQFQPLEIIQDDTEQEHQSKQNFWPLIFAAFAGSFVLTFWSSMRNFTSWFGVKSSDVAEQGPEKLAAVSISSNSGSPGFPDLSRASTLTKRWITGISLGAVATAWMFSGNISILIGFSVLSIVGQREYYDMVRKVGVSPASTTSIVASVGCYAAALFASDLHQFIVPLCVVFTLMRNLLRNNKPEKIGDMSTTIMGMFFVGFLPSFWVKLRAAKAVSVALPFLAQPFFSFIPMHNWTFGALVTWWTWCTIVFADCGAFFFGKALGKHKLSSISGAAGITSPNKTVEGAVGGFFSATLFAALGAYCMQWPFWVATGPLYGLLISVIAMVSDLTVSMMKRDAQIKDTGNLLPGHGGLLDRIDSYLLTAPVAYFFITKVLPFVKTMVENGVLPF